MKNILKLFLVVLSLLQSKNSFSQFKNPDDEGKSSIAIQPPNYSISPPGTESNTITIDGFDNFDMGVDFGEPYIATNPRDPLNSVCAFNINNLYYTVNGYDWTKVVVSFPGFNAIGDPVLTFDSLGVAIYAQLYQNGSTYGVVINKSTNKGVTWSGVSNVYGTTVGLSDKEWITADQTAGPYSNYVYACWRQFGSSGMRFVRSTDRGVTWSSPMTFTGGQGAYVSVGANGPVQGGSVYFASLSGGSILVNRSTNGGEIFSDQLVASSFPPPGIFCAGRNTVKNCIRTNAFPRMAADNSFTSTRGNVYVVYAMNPLTQDVADINMVRSTDYGVTWSTPLRVNDDMTTTDQWDPAISVDRKTGRIYVSWFDSREDPVNNIMTKVYGAVSTNGGVSFTPNAAVSNAPFNPNNMAVPQPGGERYIGDYFGNSAIGNTSYVVWMDGRNNNLGSFTGYYPDYAMTTNKSSVNLGNNDTGSVVIKIPSVKGPYVGRVKFSAFLDTLPTSGNINFSFINGRDSITTFPDSIRLRVQTTGNVPAKGYYVNIVGKGVDGAPAHNRKLILLVNSSFLTIGTNRPGIAEFKVNGASYNTTQQLIFPNSSVVTVQAISPRTIGSTQYVYTHWSDGGDTTHSITVNGNIALTAFYKTKYRLFVVSSQGTTFGGGVFYDSSSNATFGVNSRIVISGGQTYYFRGWNGVGTGSYTSSDSTGLDSVVTVAMHNAIVETARWTTTTGIVNLNTGVPDKFALHQNYPNPFNPATIINYELPITNFVTIKVYDILGNEVVTLVNEKQYAGSYAVEFDGTNLSSGIYFCKLSSENFTDIKRMILVK